MPRILYLPVKSEYFHQIASGEKTEEFRLANDHWNKRLVGREYEIVEISLGYPKKGDLTRRQWFSWQGFTEKEITHPHFGTEPVAVFAIDLSEQMPF